MNLIVQLSRQASCDDESRRAFWQSGATDQNSIDLRSRQKANELVALIVRLDIGTDRERTPSAELSEKGALGFDGRAAGGVVDTRQQIGDPAIADATLNSEIGRAHV